MVFVLAGIGCLVMSAFTYLTWLFGFIAAMVLALSFGISLGKQSDAFNKHRAGLSTSPLTKTVPKERESQLQTEQVRIDRLKKLVNVSKKLRISQMAEMLDLSTQEMNHRIVDWAADYGFTIDEDVVEFTGGRKDDFISSLDEAFADWTKKSALRRVN
ncbi:MAG TPA: hypothetical protein VKM55_04345 [Candidatus Lokiarchaeia archaeon]|nr:hypothetical protein [Candidatus Lokiarchaeia archaeon]